MRTLRELAGWALLSAAWLLPFGVLLAFVAWMEDEIPFGGFLLAALVGTAWPRLVLSARRLREPDPRDVAEADGRRPVRA